MGQRLKKEAAASPQRRGGGDQSLFGARANETADWRMGAANWSLDGGNAEGEKSAVMLLCVCARA